MTNFINSMKGHVDQEEAPKEKPKQENYKSDIDLMKEQIASLQKQLNEKNKE